MSEPAATPPRMTAAEFIRWDDGTGTRYELVDGQPVAMSPAYDPHGRIAGNAFFEIKSRLNNRRPCTAITEGGVRINDETSYVPDVVATCAPTSKDGYIDEPFLLVEVLSDSDRGKRVREKVSGYVTLSSVREIWLIDSRKRWVEQWWREGDDRWIVRLPLRGSATFDSPTLGGEPVTLDSLYDLTGL